MTVWAEPPTLREWLWVELIAPVTFMLTFVPAFLATFVVLAVVYDTETAMEIIDEKMKRHLEGEGDEP